MSYVEFTAKVDAGVGRDSAAVPSPVGYDVAKRSLDLVLACALLVLSSPLLLVLAAAVRVSSPGPALFRQARLGRNGRRFTMYKFRSMTWDTGETGCTRHRNAAVVVQLDHRKVRDHQAVTPLGAWLRRTSLDELPNLFNVLVGDMSLVGPRPGSWAPASYGTAGPEILSVKPGVTGLWQVMGRGDLTFAERVTLELEYVRRRSFVFDLWILLRTIPVVLSQRGAY